MKAALSDCRGCLAAATILALVALGSFPRAVLAAEETEPGFTMGVDPRIELLAVVQSLTSWADQGAFTKLESQYRIDAAERFGPHAEHPVVAWFEENLPTGWNFDAPPTAMLHLSAPPDLEVVFPFSDYLLARGHGDENLQKMVGLLRDFAADTDFMAFWEEQRPFYRRFVERIEGQIPFTEYTAAMEAFYGEQKSSFVFVPTPLFHGGGYGIELETPRGPVAYYIGGPHALDGGLPVFREPALRRLVFHEFGHAFVNRVVYDHADELACRESLYDNISESMRNSGYGDWPTVFHEHVVRAGESLLLQAVGFPDEARETYDANLVSYGFRLLPFVTSGLEEFERQKEDYGSFRDYFPRLLDVLDHVEWTAHPGPGPMGVYLNITEDSCRIVRVPPDSPFGLAGARPEDVIDSLNGIPVNGDSFTRVKKMWQDATPGDRLPLVLVRDGQRISTDVEVPPGEVTGFVWKDGACNDGHDISPDQHPRPTAPRNP